MQNGSLFHLPRTLPDGKDGGERLTTYLHLVLGIRRSGVLNPRILILSQLA